MKGRRIAVITAEVIAPRMAGPAIRAWHMCVALAGAGHDVELLTTNGCDAPSAPFACRHVDVAELDRLSARVDVVVAQGDVLRRAAGLRESSCVLVVDLYDPFHLESLEVTRGQSVELRRRAVGGAVDVLNEQLRRGDFFLCASDRQRDFWLGQLAAVGRLNELTYDLDPAFEALVAVVPFGVESEPPARNGAGLREVIAGVDATDRVVYWGGGIYNWFDPLTLIRAIDRLRRDDTRVKLVLAGSEHPNPDVAQTSMSRQAYELARELGLLGSHVFFHPWIEYDDRANFLLDADIGVSTDLGHVEARFSFRTRMLDYLWAGLPTVATAGDVLSEELVMAGAGLAVPPNDESALAAALATVLFDDRVRAEMSAAASGLGRQYSWPLVLQPLVEFCAAPSRSPDLVAHSTRRAISRGSDLMARPGRARLELVLDLVRRRAWGELRQKLRHWAKRSGGVR